jgi:hypothetical protein
MSASDSGSGSDDEQEKMTTQNDGTIHKPPRKKSSTKRSLDTIRKISLSKMRDEKKEKESNSHQNKNQSSPDSSTSSPSINNNNNSHSVPLKQKNHHHHRVAGPRNGRISDGYDQYLKQYLLQVPMPKDYGEPSSDDLSSEWDSDVPDNKNNEANNKESKVRLFEKSKQNV